MKIRKSELQKLIREVVSELQPKDRNLTNSELIRQHLSVKIILMATDKLVPLAQKWENKLSEYEEDSQKLGIAIGQMNTQFNDLMRQFVVLSRKLKF